MASMRSMGGISERVAWVGLSALLLVSVLGGPELLSRLGLGFLGRWGAWALWGGGLLLRWLRRQQGIEGLLAWRPEALLVLVLGSSLVLRWPMAALDVEHYVGPDEGEVVENTLEMVKTGDLHHRHPGYPGLLFYLQMVPATAHFMLAAARGEGRTIRDLPRQGFYKVARLMTLLAGWAGAVAVYWVGRGWLGREASAVAGALVAFSPLAFRESRFVSPDSLLMLFIACGLGLCLRVVEDARTPRFVWAGVGVGVAAAIKYTGAVLAASYVVAWLGCAAPRRTMAKAAAGLGCSVLAFLIVSPYTLLDLPSFFRGMTAHFGYYQAAQINAPAELSRILASSGGGVVAAAASLLGGLWVLSRVERRGMVVLSFPMAYLILFSFFHRVYPRHALVLLPSFALLAARAMRWSFAPDEASSEGVLESMARRWPLRYAFAAGLLILPLIGSMQLALAARRTTPAEHARRWVEANLPAGSRILEDQFTPQLDPNRYRLHRLHVEEEVFVGNYDWVLRSGYPPGLPTRGLRPVLRFEPQGSLGASISVYQVPDRATLMGVTLGASNKDTVLRAGELRYFGEGWLAPSPGAFGTSRLSEGRESEIFFVLEASVTEGDVAAELRASGLRAVGVGPVRVGVNGEPVASLDVQGEEPAAYRFVIPRRTLRAGLNRLVFRYPATLRLNRRHREAAIRLFRLQLKAD